MTFMPTFTHILTLQEAALAMAALRQTAENLEGNLKIYDELCAQGEKPLPDAAIDGIRADVVALRALREKLLTSGVAHV